MNKLTEEKIKSYLCDLAESRNPCLHYPSGDEDEFNYTVKVNGILVEATYKGEIDSDTESAWIEKEEINESYKNYFWK